MLSDGVTEFTELGPGKRVAGSYPQVNPEAVVEIEIVTRLENKIVSIKNQSLIFSLIFFISQAKFIKFY